MQIALTGATGFIGRYIARQLVADGHTLRAWYRRGSDRSALETIDSQIDWVEGELGDSRAADTLVSRSDAVVHAALYHPGGGFMGGEGRLLEFVQANVVGTLELIEAAQRARASRFVFISTCAVHDVILPDRPLDETHPLWPKSHYGAHKAAIEKFVHSFGLGLGFPICALRPTGVYGVAHPMDQSKWYSLVANVARGEPVECARGGKEVHAADVAKAALLLLGAPEKEIIGQAFNCYDRYISEWEVARLAQQLAETSGPIGGEQTSPKNQISTRKIRELGMKFGGEELLQQTVSELVQAVS